MHNVGCKVGQELLANGFRCVILPASGIKRRLARHLERDDSFGWYHFPKAIANVFYRVGKTPIQCQPDIMFAGTLTGHCLCQGYGITTNPAVTARWGLVALKVNYNSHGKCDFRPTPVTVLYGF